MDNKMSKKQRKLAKAEQKRKQQQEQARIEKQQQEKSITKSKNQSQNQTNGKSKEDRSSKKNKKQNKKQAQKSKETQQQQQNSGEQSLNENNDENLDFNKVLEGEQNLQFAFVIAQINEKHYHSMKTILEKFARVTGIISSDWADSIIANGKAGNVVGTDDADDEQQEQQQQQSEDYVLEEQDENVCSGVINILPNTNKLVKKVVNKIQQVVKNKQPKYHGSIKPSEALNNTCSLLVCERAVNLPAVIVKSMHEVLVQDLKSMRTSDRKQYDKICSSHILGVSQIQLPKGTSKETITADELIFTKFEDYLFLNNSQSWWIGEVSPNAVRKVPLHKLYFVIKTDKYYEAVGAIDGLLCEDGQND